MLLYRNGINDRMNSRYYPHYIGISKIVFLSVTYTFHTSVMLCEMRSIIASTQAYAVRTKLC